MTLRSNWDTLCARVVWYVLVAVALCQSARASALRGTKDFADVAAAVNAAIEKYGAEHVLLALDIDNTVMSMDNDLGSDHWFEWQNYLLQNEPDSPLLVAKDFDGLLKAQGILYQRGHMHPPQPEQPAMIEALQKRGIASILLTSRGPEFRGVTERELKRCKYDFTATALPVSNVPTGTFMAYDLSKPEKDGLTAAELVIYKLPEPRPVSYANGLFLTAGQHKGIMLLTLLKDSPRDIKAVIYADDNLRHVGNVFSAGIARNLDVSSFHYQAEDTRVQRFNYSDKKDVDRGWRAVERELQGEPSEAAKVATVRKQSPMKKTVVIRKRTSRPCCCR